MRSVRNTAVVGATVLALALGTTTATAQESDPAATQAPSLSSQLNTSLNLEGDQEANGREIFGSSKGLEDQPAWAQALYALTILGGVGAFVGLIGGPLYNYVVHGPQA